METLQSSGFCLPLLYTEFGTAGDTTSSSIVIAPEHERSYLRRLQPSTSIERLNLSDRWPSGYGASFRWFNDTPVSLSSLASIERCVGSNPTLFNIFFDYFFSDSHNEQRRGKCSRSIAIDLDRFESISNVTICVWCISIDSTRSRLACKRMSTNLPSPSRS